MTGIHGGSFPLVEDCDPVKAVGQVADVVADGQACSDGGAVGAQGLPGARVQVVFVFHTIGFPRDGRPCEGIGTSDGRSDAGKLRGRRNDNCERACRARRRHAVVGHADGNDVRAWRLLRGGAPTKESG